MNEEEFSNNEISDDEYFVPKRIYRTENLPHHKTFGGRGGRGGRNRCRHSCPCRNVTNYDRFRKLLQEDYVQLDGQKIFVPKYYLRNGYEITNNCKIHLIKTSNRTGYLENDDQTEIWIYHQGPYKFFRRENAPNFATEMFGEIHDYYSDDVEDPAFQEQIDDITTNIKIWLTHEIFEDFVHCGHGVLLKI